MRALIGCLFQPYSGSIVVIGQLDREAVDHYTLVVSAYDGGETPRMVKFKI